ncbi:MAG: dynamin family protein [Herpetosiphonaceae bacterium]|nr:dynamin family protein [Herpetosiphonaceae bacterium]
MLGLLGKRKLLGQRQEKLLAEERAVIERLQRVLAGLGTDVQVNDLRTLADAALHLDELFLLVVAGEFNSGKSSFINALIGQPVLREGVTPTTDQINILKYGDHPAEQHRDEYVLEILYPAPVLREINVVDTPGTNAIIRRHEELTRDFIPRSDLVLFVTSADRPFTESERAFLQRIREWGKKIVIVINKIDILQPAEVQQVLAFVRDNAGPLLGRSPEVFGLSARLAQRAKSNNGDPAAWQASGFEAIERYITDTLDEEERIRLKLLNPLGVTGSLNAKYKTLVDNRLTVLREDFATLDSIDKQIDLYRDDLQRDFKFHLTEIENLLNEMELRGMSFFDDTVRIGRMFDLMKKDRIRTEFEDKVVGDTPQLIEARVQAIIDWLVERQLRLWKSVTEYLNRRRLSQNREDMLGEVGTSFEYNRKNLIESVGRTARDVVSQYDRQAESAELAQSVQSAMAATALLEVGAVGMGGILVAVLTGVAADFTGLLAASAVAAMGFYIIPSKRKQAKSDFHAKISELRDQLARTINRQVGSEMEASIAQIREAMGPYTRFVRSQRDTLGGIETELAQIETLLGRLRGEIGRDPTA